MASEKVRESVIAGSWYPGHPDTLQREIRKYLDQADVSPPAGTLVALIVPHAGYMYSGGVAAYAYKLLEGRKFDRVMIVAPSHRAYFKGASVSDLGGYRTPLGHVPLDHHLVDALHRHSEIIQDVPDADAQEHSLEIQLPFLQVILKDFQLTPVIMGEQSFEACEQLAHIIADICRDEDVLLVASSDLSHYHPYNEAKRLDQIVTEKVDGFDPQGLAQALSKGECEACGAGPMMTVMLAAKELGANRAKVLHYANSGDVTGDTRGVVGYLAAALYSNPGTDRKRQHPERGKVGVDLGLSNEEKQTLREIALQAIRSHCLGEPMPDLPVASHNLSEPRGAFVSIHKGKELRGCIGALEGMGPLHKTIEMMAIQAAFSDPRFPPLDSSELASIDIELSVLTPFTRMKDLSEIEIGKHGLLIRKGYHSGLLLPQVATDNNWDREHFLEWTCRKAGLLTDAWKAPDTEIYLFSADVF
ncbi:MAG: AmmeMemoRadiSam system protein B [Syntrophobacteraceae bacterium]